MNSKRVLALTASFLLAVSACGTTDNDEATAVAETTATTAEVTPDLSTPADDDSADDDSAESPVDGEPADDPAADDDVEPAFELQGELPIGVAEVNGMIEFIETETGRAFLRPPVIVVQEAETFASGLLPTAEEADDVAAEAELLGQAYRALDLSDSSGPELLDSITEFLTSPEGIGGYYDPEVDELYVPAGADTDLDMFRSLLVHELTHALDGQHVDLQALIEELDGTVDPFFDSAFPERAAVEGRATAVQLRYNRAEGLVLPIPQLDTDVPNVYVLTLSLPYQTGAQWVELNGGPAETWQALETAPPTSEIILFGRDDDPAVVVEAPEADGEVLAEGQLGSTGIVIWLAGNSLEPTPELMTAIQAADGWAGDSYVLWAGDDETCVRANIAGDDEVETGEIVSAFEAWAATSPSNGGSRSVEIGTEYITATSCGPEAS